MHLTPFSLAQPLRKVGLEHVLECPELAAVQAIFGTSIPKARDLGPKLHYKGRGDAASDID
jgi:hypothetical protein